MFSFLHPASNHPRRVSVLPFLSETDPIPGTHSLQAVRGDHTLRSSASRPVLSHWPLAQPSRSRPHVASPPAPSCHPGSPFSASFPGSLPLPISQMLPLPKVTASPAFSFHSVPVLWLTHPLSTLYLSLLSDDPVSNPGPSEFYCLLPSVQRHLEFSMSTHNTCSIPPKNSLPFFSEWHHPSPRAPSWTPHKHPQTPGSFHAQVLLLHATPPPHPPTAAPALVQALVISHPDSCRNSLQAAVLSSASPSRLPPAQPSSSFKCALSKLQHDCDHAPTTPHSSPVLKVKRTGPSSTAWPMPVSPPTASKFP